MALDENLKGRNYYTTEGLVYTPRLDGWLFLLQHKYEDKSVFPDCSGITKDFKAMFGRAPTSGELSDSVSTVRQNALVIAPYNILKRVLNFLGFTDRDYWLEVEGVTDGPAAC